MTLARALARERSRLAGVLGAAGAAAAVALALAALAAAAFALGHGRWITRPAAPLVAWIFALAALAAAAVATGRVLRRRAAPAVVARDIEREHGLRAGALRAAAESVDQGAFGRRASEMMAVQLSGMGTVLAPAALSAARGVLALGAATFLGAALFAAAAAYGAPDGWRAMRHPGRALAGTLLPPIAILNAPASVIRGDSVRVTVAAPGRATITLASRTTGAAWQQRALGLSDGAALATVGPLDADLTLVAGDGRALSDTVTIRVRDRAFMGDVAVEAVYPAYLARAPEPLPAGEPMHVPQGTVLRIEARASADLTAAGLVREGAADTVRLAARGRRASGRLDAGHGGRWRWYALGTGGPVVDLPAPLEVDVVADAPPRAEILAPAADTVLDPETILMMRLAAADDHGVARVTLRSWRDAGGRAMPAMEQLVAQPGTAAWAAEWPLDLAPRSLVPGDALHVVLAVTDNSPWHQEAQSRELLIRVPTLAEQRALARALGDSTAARTAAAAGAQRDLEQRTQEAARARGDRAAAERNGPRSMNYETAARAAALARAQEQLAAQVRAAEKDAAALERALKAAGALDTSLARQLRDAQQLLHEALTPEMARQLAAVMNASQKLSPEETRRALEQLAKQQDRLRAELERTAGMLRRAALEGAMQTLRDDARDLAARGQRVADSLAHRDPAAPAAAATVSEQSKALAAQIAALQERLAREQADAAAERMPAAAEHARRGAEQMANASQSASPEQGRAGARELSQAADQLAAAREAQVAAWKESLTAELDKAGAEAMQLSQAESDLAQQAAGGADSSLRGQQSAVQQGVERLSSRLDKAAGQSAHVSPASQRALAEARQRVAEATREIAESRRGGREAAPELASASQALSQAAAQMMRDRARAAGAQSASGFAEMMQRMAELAKQQGGVNAQAAGLLPSPGASPSALAAEQARALAQQQRAIAKALEEAGAGDARAAQMAREMRDIAAALDRGTVDPALLQRQQQLFHRLLDAGLAMEKDEREDTGRRESRAAADAAAFAPAQGAATGRAAVTYGAPGWPELRGLTADERQAVLDYFSRLNDARTP